MRLLREFLYVDTAKVRGLLAQLDEGILESTVSIEASRKVTGGGIKGIATHQQEWGDTSQLNKTLGDAMFPTLEDALESEHLLYDLSEDLANSTFWLSGVLQREYPAGTLVRITCQGHLFDSRFVARTFANFASTAVGLQNLDAMDTNLGPPPAVPPKAKQRGSSAKGPKPPRRAVPPEWEERPMEAEIPPDFLALDGAITGRALHGMIQVSRGVYSPGLFLNLRPCDELNHVVSARLEEGRSFLDSQEDVLFARYGVGSQEWTLVGTIGHHGAPAVETDFSQGNFTDNEGNVIRSSFSEFVNSFMQFIGGLGLADLVQAPAFSVVPIAVYRVLNPRQVGSSLIPAVE